MITVCVFQCPKNWSFLILQCAQLLLDIIHILKKYIYNKHFTLTFSLIIFHSPPIPTPLMCRNGTTTTYSGTSPSTAKWTACASTRSGCGCRICSCTTGKSRRAPGSHPSTSPQTRAILSDDCGDQWIYPTWRSKDKNFVKLTFFLLCIFDVIAIDIYFHHLLTYTVYIL